MHKALQLPVFSSPSRQSLSNGLAKVFFRCISPSVTQEACDQEWTYCYEINHYTSTTTFAMATKLGRMVTYLEGLVAIKSHDLLNKYSWEMAWQTKTILSPLYYKPLYLKGHLIIMLLNPLVTCSYMIK